MLDASSRHAWELYAVCVYQEKDEHEHLSLSERLVFTLGESSSIILFLTVSFQAGSTRMLRSLSPTLENPVQTATTYFL